MSGKEQVLDEPKDAVAPKTRTGTSSKPDTNDEVAYEDNWYQVLKQRNEGTSDPE